MKGIKIYEEVANYEVIENEQPQTLEQIEDDVLKDLDENNGKVDESILRENREEQELILKGKKAKEESQSMGIEKEKPQGLFKNNNQNGDYDLPF